MPDVTNRIAQKYGTDEAKEAREALKYVRYSHYALEYFYAISSTAYWSNLQCYNNLLYAYNS